jgi:hypothetical protein
MMVPSAGMAYLARRAGECGVCGRDMFLLFGFFGFKLEMGV